MIGDDINLSVELKKELIIEEVQKWLTSIFEDFVENSVVKRKRDTLEEYEDSKSLWDEFLVDYINDYNVPANFGVTYFATKHSSNHCKMMSLGAMNHPAGELMIYRGDQLGSLLKDNITKLVLLTNDSEYLTLDLITNYYLEDLEGCGIIKDWK